MQFGIRGKIQPFSLLTKLSTCRCCMSFFLCFHGLQNSQSTEMSKWTNLCVAEEEIQKIPTLSTSKKTWFFWGSVNSTWPIHHYQITFQISFPNSGLTSLIFLISENEPDSIFQKLQRFGPNLLMLGLLKVCANFTLPLFLSYMLNTHCFWKLARSL